MDFRLRILNSIELILWEWKHKSVTNHGKYLIYISAQFEISWVSRTDWVWSKYCLRILIKTNFCDPIVRIKDKGWKLHYRLVMPIGAINSLCFNYWPCGWPPYEWRFWYIMKALISIILSTQVSITRTEIICQI